jgi:hypothetical protein
MKNVTSPGDIFFDGCTGCFGQQINYTPIKQVGLAGIGWPGFISGCGNH